MRDVRALRPVEHVVDQDQAGIEERNLAAVRRELELEVVGPGGIIAIRLEDRIAIGGDEA